MNHPTRPAPARPAAGAAPAGALRPRLYVLSPLPPQHNGLADYIAEYLEPLARDYRLVLVAESAVSREVEAHYASLPIGAQLEVIDEGRFSARMPEPDARVLYNLGNNRDCAWLLDYLHRYPGAVLLHDISLFFLHQIMLNHQRADGMMARWMQEDGYRLPDAFLHPDGSLASSPGMAYQECLMVRRVVESASTVVVHSRYALRRALGGVIDPVPGGGTPAPGLERKFVRMPHFVLPPPEIPVDRMQATCARYGVGDDDFVVVVPGFLTGNKMLYECLVACERVARQHPQLKLVFAGEERADEYPISAKIAQLHPEGDGPVVTGYLDSDELDVLLARADLSLVLRYPTYGETSGILPRAVMGGGVVVTVDIGSYPEFEGERIDCLAVGPGFVSALEQSILRAIAGKPGLAPRAQRQADARRRAAALAPPGLYRSLHQAIEAGVAAPPTRPGAGAPAAAPARTGAQA